MSCIHDLSYAVLDEGRNRWSTSKRRTVESLAIVKGNVDQIYTVGSDQQLLTERPWRKDPHYFNKVYISSLALIKMAVHAKSGGSLEIMGMMTGKIVPSGIVVMDCYALPIEGTETRVNAQSEGYEFMVQYLESSKKIGREENIVGWYHSHPGYGCWLSGIDVATQALNQNFQDPYLAIVIDPLRGDTFGKIEIGCFRTYPPNYEKKVIQQKEASDKKNEESPGKKDPLKQKKKRYHLSSTKSKDLGIHANRYYQIEIEVFKSSLDSDLLELMATKQSWDNLLCGSAEVSDFNLSVQMDQAEELTELISKMNLELTLNDLGLLSLGRVKVSELYASAFDYMLRKRGNGLDGGRGYLCSTEERSLEDLDMVDEEEPTHDPRMLSKRVASGAGDMADDYDGDLEGYKTFSGGYLGNIDEVGGEDQEADTDVGTDAPEEDDGSTSDFDDDDANSMVEERPTRKSLLRYLSTSSKNNSKLFSSRGLNFRELRRDKFRTMLGSNTPESRDDLVNSTPAALTSSLSLSANANATATANTNVYAMFEKQLQDGEKGASNKRHGLFNYKGHRLSQQIAARSLEEIYGLYTQERLFLQ